jgi:heme exporter protein D
MIASHLGFVVTAYSFAALVLVTLVGWIALDYRVQQKKLAELEAKRGKK